VERIEGSGVGEEGCPLQAAMNGSIVSAPAPMASMRRNWDLDIWDIVIILPVSGIGEKLVHRI
jgi:hypothetical protein